MSMVHFGFSVYGSAIGLSVDAKRKLARMRNQERSDSLIDSQGFDEITPKRAMSEKGLAS